MEPEAIRSRMDTVARITQITMAVSIIVGIFAALYGLYDTKRQADISFATLRMTQLEALQGIILKNRKLQEDEIEPFMKKLVPNEEESGAKNCEPRLFGEDGGLLSAKEILEYFKWVGQDAYYHDCFEEFVAVGRYYDELGAMVRLGYVDFDFLFTLLPFPDKFWEATREYRVAIAANWEKKDDPLPDFWINFSWLRDEYRKERRRAGEG